MKKKKKVTNEPIKIKLLFKIFLGFIVGFISAPMGIGGAIMNVPILKFFGYSINKAIGSAAAIGFFNCFIWNNWFFDFWELFKSRYAIEHWFF